ncbi:hypothetical protein EJB05_49263 [Eragrostis curvula]|uniref:Protein RFT1 homolog n=1 Tax=Eragrostis curvula TaxID=38414 RepID=A0A5J9T6D5_9POAL|nr:hypothetical protein EJB05_49263 [Eragrostis curvula]
MAADGDAPPQSTDGATGSRRSRESLFGYLVALQLLTKLVSFVFNSWCMGAVEGFSGSMLQATSFVDRVLYYREGFRRGCLHGGFGFDDKVTDESRTKLLKVARMAFPIGIVATIVGCIHELWKQKIKFSDPSAAAVFGFENPYVQAILINGFACILELLAEPLYILSQNLFLLKLRLISEVVATLMRCIRAYILLHNLNMEMVVVFPLSQAMYSSCLLFAYWFYFLLCHVSKLHCVFPRRVQDWMDYDKRLWQACMMFTGQSLKELVVQKGQELVPFRSSYLDEYGVVDRLGSLVVRLIFRPFEESNRLKFAEMASGQTTQTILSLRASLVQCLKINCLAGLLIIAFGPGYSYTLLRMVYKDRHCDGPTQLLLILYWFYVISLAFNGTLEAFLQSIASQSQLKMLNNFSLISSVVYVLIKVLLIGYAGAVGLIISDTIIWKDMLLKISYFMVFTRRFFQNSYAISIHQVLPSGWWVLVFSGAATIISDMMVLNKESKETYWQSLPLHVGIGTTCFLLSCAVIYPREKALIEKFIKLHKHRD